MTKSTPKKTASKKATAKTVKAPAATRAKSLKKPVQKKASSSKAKKDDLLGTIANLETRMKRANTLTRKSVKALETAVMALDARTRSILNLKPL